jgi:hypothetical protein
LTTARKTSPNLPAVHPLTSIHRLVLLDVMKVISG